MNEVEKLKELCDRLALTVYLLSYDAHQVYSSTATHHGGIGGQAFTKGCAFLDPSNKQLHYDVGYYEKDMREWITSRGSDLSIKSEELLKEWRDAYERDTTKRSV